MSRKYYTLAACCWIAVSALSTFAQEEESNLVGVAMGGYGGGKSVELITETRICSGSASEPTIPHPLTGSIVGSVSEYVDEEIYLCGGQALDQSKACNHLAIGGSWKSSCNMKTRRRFAASTIMNGQMVIMGGYNTKQGWLTSVEIKTKNKCALKKKPEWEMLTGKFQFCAVAKGSRIYTIGGSTHNFTGNDDVANLDVLDTNSNEWSALEPMPKSRSYPGCSLYTLDGDEGILVAGGCDNDCHEHLYDTLFYSFNTKKWSTLAARLNEARMGARLVLIKGKPTLIGGYHRHILGSIEEFDGSSWHLREDKLDHDRWAYGMATIPAEKATCP